MFRRALNKISSSTVDLPDFKYEALPDSSKYLRLVEVFPEENQHRKPRKPSKVCCKISHVLVSDSPVYQALSYTWGDDAPSHDIELNGSHFQVTQNLYWFLYHYIRSSNLGSKTRLWIDAICINQNEPTEKGHQVQMMGEIYQKAQSVFVWLGHQQDSDVERALPFLIFAEQHFGDASVEERYRKQFGDDGTRLIVALQTLFETDYWSRTWIVQEVILAKMLVICCGSRQITWNSLDFWTRNTNMIFTAMGKPPREPYLPVHRHRAEDVLTMRNLRESKQDSLLRLSSLINTNAETYCKDPRDRVYAFLSLADTPKYAEMIQVDYTKTIEEVFFDVVKFLQEERQNILASYLELNYQHPGEKELALFDCEQTFLLVANKVGVVANVFKPTESLLFLPWSNGLVSKYSLFGVKASWDPDQYNYRGLANSDIRAGDILYNFDHTAFGFIARASESTKDTSEVFDIISKATVNYTSDLPEELPLFSADIKFVDGKLNFDRFRIRKFAITDDFFQKHEVWFDVGRREIVQVLFEEVELRARPNWHQAQMSRISRLDGAV